MMRLFLSGVTPSNNLSPNLPRNPGKPVLFTGQDEYTPVAVLSLTDAALAWPVYRSIVRSLGQPQASSESQLREYLTRTFGPAHRNRVIIKLAQSEDPAALEMAAKLGDMISNPSLRDDVLSALAQYPSSDVSLPAVKNMSNPLRRNRVLQELAESDDVDVLYTVANAGDLISYDSLRNDLMGKLAEHTDPRVCIPATRNLTTPELRDAAYEALALRNDPMILQSLHFMIMSHIADPDLIVRILVTSFQHADADVRNTAREKIRDIEHRAGMYSSSWQTKSRYVLRELRELGLFPVPA